MVQICPSPPYRVNHSNVAVVKGKLYLLGGLTDGSPLENGQINWVAYSECYKYETTASEWKSLEDIPARTERGSACVGVSIQRDDLSRRRNQYFRPNIKIL